jgi:hypothetical protein
MGTVTPIYARRDAEERRLHLQEASARAQLRLSRFPTDDHVTIHLIGLLILECYRIEHFALNTKYEEECLRSLRYIRMGFEMSEHNLRVLLTCLYVVDDKYRDAV